MEWDMNQHPEIPFGYYCYTIVNIEYGEKTDRSASLAKIFGTEDKGESIIKTKLCPHWKCDPERNVQENGYCELTGVKDWIDGTLLWDQVKECSINIDEGDVLGS